MKIVIPRVFVIGESVAIQEGLEGMLEHLGVPDWQTDAASDTEKLSEIAGKLCYMSFDTELNANLTRTGGRNNYDYLQIAQARDKYRQEVDQDKQKKIEDYKAVFYEKLKEKLK